MTEWNTIPLGDLGATHPRAFATGPFGSAVSAKNFRSSGVPMIRGANLSDQIGIRLNEEGLVFVSGDLADQYGRSIARRGDLVFTSWGTVGQVGLIDDRTRFDTYLVSNKQMKMTPNPDLVDERFLYYNLSQPVMIDLVKAQSIGSSVPGFNLGQLKSLPISLPKLSVQRAIAEVLGALDDKIAANQRTVGIADELVRARYSALSGEEVPLRTLAANVRELVDPRVVSPETPYIGLEHVPRRSLWLADFDVAAKVTSAKARFRNGDVLFGKLRPYFHKVVDAPFDGIASTDILVLRALEPELAGLLLAAASSDKAIAATTAASEGTRMPRTKWDDLAVVDIPWPGRSKALKFSQEVMEIAGWAALSMRESRRLAATRDELLPLLMSGKIRVKDGEKTVEGVL